MEDQYKFKVIGAFAIGFAIVGGAYTVTHFGQSSFAKPPAANPQAALVVSAPERKAIPVADTNSDGIEDWREGFVDSGQSVIIPNANSSSTFTIPDTLTDQVGINFTQSIIRSQAYAGIGKSQEQVITDTVDQITNFAEDRIIGVREITISKDSSPEALRQYANEMALIILSNNNNDITENELVILRDAIDSKNPAKIEQLSQLALVYENNLKDSLLVPVPELLVKEHLDLINVYNAMYNNILTMSKALNDPMLTLVRLKRYEDDANGLALSLQNLYLTLEPYASYFKADDPALYFVIFSPNYQ